MENIFEKGCLVQLATSSWRATRKIDPSQIPPTETSKKWLSATKKLIDPEALKPIQKIVNTARSYLSGVSLPFPIPGMVFVPKDMIAGVDGKLDLFRHEFNEAVEGFAARYHDLRITAMEHLGSLFNELDYPPDVRAKFALAWRFIVLDVPNGNTGVLSPEVYEREKEKFINTMEEARELAIQSLREEFGSMISRITERFTTGPDGKPKVFKNSTVNGFYEFFETFKDRNIFHDDQLAELVDRAKSILNGTQADTIRTNEDLKEQIGNEMAGVEDAMVELFERPRRKIVLN